jgi:hypothetical protein
MTYKELKAIIDTMSDDDINKEITVLLCDAGEFVQDVDFAYSDNTDTLPYGTPYLLTC